MEDNGQDNATEIPESLEAEEIPEPLEEAPAIQAKRPDSRLRRTMRSGMRWVLGFLVVFGLGAVLVVFTLYIPAQRKIQQANQDYLDLENRYNADMEQAKQQASELERRISSLSVLETLNQSLGEQVDASNLHVVILSARTDVVLARLALAKSDTSKARISLSKTHETLKTLEELLDPDQRNAVIDMQNRLTLILEEIEENTYAAESDLDVLATGLLELENAYFTGP